MKHAILVLFFMMLAGTQQTFAKITIGNSEKLKVVYELPNTEDYMSNPGRFMDLGILYKTFDIFGMPLWLTEDPVFIGLENHNTTVYFDLDAELVDELIAENKLNKEALKSLTFMDKHLGILAVIALILFVYLFNRFTGNRKDEITVIEDEDGKPISN